MHGMKKCETCIGAWKFLGLRKVDGLLFWHYLRREHRLASMLIGANTYTFEYLSLVILLIGCCAAVRLVRRTGWISVRGAASGYTAKTAIPKRQ